MWSRDRIFMQERQMHPNSMEVRFWQWLWRWFWRTCSPLPKPQLYKVNEIPHLTTFYYGIFLVTLLIIINLFFFQWLEKVSWTCQLPLHSWMAFLRWQRWLQRCFWRAEWKLSSLRRKGRLPLQQPKMHSQVSFSRKTFLTTKSSDFFSKF